MRESDLAARLGGDEFAALFEDTDGPQAEAAAKRILQTLAPPVDVTGHALPADPSGPDRTAGAGARTSQAKPAAAPIRSSSGRRAVRNRMIS